MKKTFIILLGVLFLFGMCCCSKSGEDTSLEENVIPFDQLNLQPMNISTEEAVTDDIETTESELQENMPNEQLTETEPQENKPNEHLEETIQCFETHLPDIATADTWLPPYVELSDYSVGDIGNDTVNDIAVIVYVNPEESDYYNYVVLLFSEVGDSYELTGYNENIVWYGDEVEISDGRLHILQGRGPQDSQCFFFVFEKQGSDLVLCEFKEEFSYVQTQQGIRILYDLKDGKAEAYAFSMQEDGFEPWLLYTADAEAVITSLEETHEDCLPTIVQSTIEYTEEGEWYNYHKLPLAEMTDEIELEDWQQAYLDLFQYFMLEEFKEYGYYYENIYFSFVYIDNDDIPELVMVMQNQFTSLYAYTPGAETNGVQNISTIMNGWNLARSYIGPRCYLPYENFFCFEYYGYDREFGAFYREFWYATTSEDRDSLEKVYDICKREFEGDYENEEDNVIKYYYNDEEVSQEVYQSYYVEEDYSYLSGDKYAYEIIDEMLEL